MSIELTTEIDPADVSTYLELQREASLPYDEFVYDDEAQARRVQRILFDAKVGEWAPPQGRAAISDGRLVGMFAGAHARDLQRVRLNASLVLGRAGILENKDLAHRMQLAVQTLSQPREGDYYQGGIGVTLAARGTDVGAELLELSRQQAREGGARRVVGQALADNPRLIAYYERGGYYGIGEGKASDPKTGRKLHYWQCAFDL